MGGTRTIILPSMKSGPSKSKKIRLHISNKSHSAPMKKGTLIILGTNTSFSLFPARCILHCALIGACLNNIFIKWWTCTSSQTRGPRRGKA